MATKRTVKPVSQKITSLQSLRENQDLIVEAPSGNVYKIRPITLERHVMAGGLPDKLRKAALAGSKGINEMFAEEDSGELSEYYAEMKVYLDKLVMSLIIEPELTEETIELLPPVDYRWAINVANGEELRDGKGVLLWGSEKLSDWETFRSFHNCAEDCKGCRSLLAALSAASRQSDNAVSN